MEMCHCRYAVASAILGSILVCATVYSPPQARSRFEWDVKNFRFFSPQIFSEILEELQDFGGNDLTLKISCLLIIAVVGDGLFSCSIPSLGDGSDACDIRLLM